MKTYVRAHDVMHGVNLEKAGATAVVPETLEPSLQLAATVLATLEYQGEEVGMQLDENWASGYGLRAGTWGGAHTSDAVVGIVGGVEYQQEEVGMQGKEAGVKGGWPLGAVEAAQSWSWDRGQQWNLESVQTSLDRQSLRWALSLTRVIDNSRRRDTLRLAATHATPGPHFGRQATSITTASGAITR